MFRNKGLTIACFMLLGLMVAGCQIVHVQDQEGKAVGWAKVTVKTGDKPGNFPVHTDFLGNATLLMSDADPQDKTPEMLEVSKEGYQTATVRRSDSNQTVTLRKTPTRPGRSMPTTPNAKTKK